MIPPMLGSKMSPMRLGWAPIFNWRWTGLTSLLSGRLLAAYDAGISLSRSLQRLTLGMSPE